MRARLQIIDAASEKDGKFYVYLYRDVRPEREGVPIYVGKGINGRARFHWERGCTSRGLREILRDIKAASLVPVVEIVARFHTEAEAFHYERQLILRFGRRELGTGPLCNLSDGGEGPVGHRHTTDVLAKIAEASRKMHSDPDFVARRARSISAALSRPEVRAARSVVTKEVHARPGQREKRLAGQKATFATAEYKAKQSAASTAMQKRPEVKAAHRDGLRRRHAAPGAKERVGAVSKVRHSDPEIKAKHKAAMAAFRARPDVIEKYKTFYEARRQSRLLLGSSS